MTDAQPRVLVIGEALVDVVPDNDGQPQDFPGGSPANVAIALSRLGRDVRLVTLLGDDDRGAAVRSWLEASDVTVLARTTASGRTSSAAVTLDESGAASYVFDLDWHLDEIPDDGCDVLHAGSIATVLEPGADTVLAAFRAHRGRALISLDPNARPSITPDRTDPVRRVEELVTLSDVVKVSDEDLHWLHPDDDPVATAARWAGVGPGLVVVTRGGDGASWYTRGETTEVASVPVAVADTIGAGDTFGAAMIDALWERGRLGAARRRGLRALDPGEAEEVLAHAARAAAVTVSRPGADPPYRSELDS